MPNLPVSDIGIALLVLLVVIQQVVVPLLRSKSGPTQEIRDALALLRQAREDDIRRDTLMDQLQKSVASQVESMASLTRALSDHIRHDDQTMGRIETSIHKLTETVNDFCKRAA